MALWQHWKQQEQDRLTVGELWQDLDWVPREIRHTFVSISSANGVSVESTAQLADHDSTATTESVYRHEIRPALTKAPR